MRKNIIVSNRLPVQVTKSKNNYIFRPSSGGLATGLSSVHTQKDSLWIGWAGIAYDDISDKQNINIEKSYLDSHLPTIGVEYRTFIEQTKTGEKEWLGQMKLKLKQ